MNVFREEMKGIYSKSEKGFLDELNKIHNMDSVYAQRMEFK